MLTARGVGTRTCPVGRARRRLGGLRRTADAYFYFVLMIAVVDTLGTLSKDADIVFLTAMPPQFWEQRRRLLDRLELAYPLLASLQPKGPIVRSLHRQRTMPVAFVDDMAHNLHSVSEHVPECLLINLKPDSIVHRMAPAAPAGIPEANEWTEAAPLIRAHIAR